MSKRSLTPEEKQLWEQAMRGAKRLPKNALGEVPAPVKKIIKQAPPAIIPSVKPLKNTIPLEQSNYAGVDRSTATHFKKGDMKLDGTLDLHGMTRVKAQDALMRFIRSHCEKDSRALLVITGKGFRKNENSDERGILRELLPRWLKEESLRPLILAFDTARPKHGGAGAYYILLRRRRA